MSVLTETQPMMDTDAPSPASYANNSTSWTPSDGMTPISTNPSRKRSRDESAIEAAEAENPYFSAAQIPEPIPEEPIYGEGMVLLNPTTGRALAAESQTGTWFEDKVAEEEQAAKEATTEARPVLPVGRKSIRMSQSSIRAAVDLPNLSAPSSPPKSQPTEVDEASIALGLSWKKIPDDPDLQAAARGWARYLDVHYPQHIHGAEILLKNTSLDAYLVGCQEGFYLFQEDLLRGQLVGRNWDIALQNLKQQPLVFEGNEILQAERTPGPDPEASKVRNTINGWNQWGSNENSLTTNNGVTTNGQTAASDMDLS